MCIRDSCYRILNGSPIREGNLKIVSCSIESHADTCMTLWQRRFFNKYLSPCMHTRPVHKFFRFQRLVTYYCLLNNFIIAAIYYQRRIHKQFKLLLCLNPDIMKILTMSVTDICNYPNIRINDLLKSGHFARKRNSCFKYTELVLVFKLQD